jgi:hypothetical protein
MNKITDKLDKLGQQIEEAKKNVSLYEGQKIQLLKQLKDLGYKTIEEAEKDLVNMEKEISAKQLEIEDQFDSLRENYDW